jgi:hypothetical protein
MRRNDCQKRSKKGNSSSRAEKRMIRRERDREDRQQERKKKSEKKEEIKREEGKKTQKRGKRIRAILSNVCTERCSGGRKRLPVCSK